MQRMTFTTWAEFRDTVIVGKKLAFQEQESTSHYDLYAQEGAFLWGYSILKDGGADVLDYETNHRANRNLPVEVRGEAGKPMRVTPSSQPMGKSSKWKGFRHKDTAGQNSFFFLMEHNDEIYLRGGRVYCENSDPDDKIQVDIVLKSDTSVVVDPLMLESIYITPASWVPFISDESMKFPNTVALKVTYTKKSGDTTNRNVDAIMDFFK